MFLEGDRRGGPVVLAVSLVAFACGWLLAIFTSTLARWRSFAYADIAAVMGGEHSPHSFEDFRLGIVIETRDGRRWWIWVPDRYTEVADAINKQLRADRSDAGIRR